MVPSMPMTPGYPYDGMSVPNSPLMPKKKGFYGPDMGMDFTDEDFAEVARRFVRAATLMQEDGWFWVPAEASNASVGRTLLRELLRSRFGLGQPNIG